MGISLTNEEVDAIVAYFKGDQRYVAIGATYITPKDGGCVRVVSSVLNRCKMAQQTR